MHRKRVVLLTLFLLAVFVTAFGLWLRAQQRQYALNRRLIAALVKNDTRTVLALVNEGAAPNTRFEPSPAPSMLQMIRHLLHRSSSPVNDSPTAFLIACGARWTRGYVLIYGYGPKPLDDYVRVRAMLTHNANVNATDENRMTPLMWATWYDRLETAQLLLEHGANINARDKYGCTTLFNSVYYGNKDSVRQLLAHGADPNLVNQNGTTPLFWAEHFKHPDLVALLKQYGAREPRKRL